MSVYPTDERAAGRRRGSRTQHDLKVMFVTGYAENAVLSHGHLDQGMQVVTKPFDMTVLANRISPWSRLNQGGCEADPRHSGIHHTPE